MVTVFVWGVFVVLVVSLLIAVGIEVAFVLAAIVATTATTVPSSSATVATATTSVLIRLTIATTFSLLFAEVVVVRVGDSVELNKAVTNVLFVFVIVGILGVFGSGECDNSFTCVLAVWVLADFDRLFIEVITVEELFDVIVRNSERQTNHFQASLLPIATLLAT